MRVEGTSDWIELGPSTSTLERGNVGSLIKKKLESDLVRCYEILT